MDMDQVELGVNATAEHFSSKHDLKTSRGYNESCDTSTEIELRGEQPELINGLKLGMHHTNMTSVFTMTRMGKCYRSSVVVASQL